MDFDGVGSDIFGSLDTERRAGLPGRASGSGMAASGVNITHRRPLCASAVGTGRA